MENEAKKITIPTLDLDTKKEIAKIGMTATMGITVATSFYMKNKLMKRLHVVAGAALVGFSYWHHTLYQPAKKVKNISMVLKEEVLEEFNEKNLAISLNNFFVEVAITGKLTHKEFALFQEKIELLMETYKVPSMNILLDITQIEGIELKALWDDLIFTMNHIDELKKIAIVGNNKVEEYTVHLADKLFSFDLEYFEEYIKAKQWLLEGRPSK
ncbi:STAS/SEC14 domain-containing protein [Candidatus Marinarcus aquaticus]|uniref:STAS/SEC14 domain-containing protein n=1 Tax=Candidatus Marinarcus aquaticus TaxID=2044504 RepID=UPI0013E95A10|nr:STAS/SEC14 domain-containing protein [Candidatus Marinarcus aquaticus]